ncbi:hypothetical protein [Plantactinospora sp. ZYX-F-223]|uniref:hypothetical protein n=1 Tax=Plantactinospora sp. ZYX-F-223 TaxID=3144103 RepID=UPI0031FDD643
MSEVDPHIHVDRRVVQASAGARDVLASAFGLITDAPAVVSTGCGLEVPYAMTSPRPESVTCLPCREHAHREHLRFADQIERLGRMAGSTITGDQASQVAQRHRGLAERFSTEA